MNERIADLLEQAFDRCKKYDDEGKTGLVRTTEAFHLFAELIVRECVMMADDFELDVNRSGLVERMKKHFGVE